MGFGGAIKSGGGFLSDVAGAITGYEFTTRPPNGKPKDKSEWVYFVPSILQDGAKAEITQHFFMGGEDQYTISDDGLTVTSEGGVSIGGKTPAGKLFASLVAAGFPEDELPDLEGGDDLNLEAIVDKRFRFGQVVDAEAMAKLGKRKATKKNKAGKFAEYDRTNTVVTAYYEADAKAGKGKAAVAGKAGKGKSKAAEMDDECGDVLKAVLAEADDNELPYKKLSMALTRKFLKIKVENDKDAMKDRILDEEFLGTEDGWEYDSKKQLVSAAA